MREHTATLMTDSSLPETHFLREMAIAVAASDALAGEDSSSVENAVVWARRLFGSVEAEPIHNGDCVYACSTCTLCFVQAFIDEARERSGLDEEGRYKVGEPPPRRDTSGGAALPKPARSAVQAGRQEGEK